MDYNFPLIRHINDVLPHIEGRDEFIVAQREGYTVINYAVAMEDTFPPVKVNGGSARMREERALTNAMRRECRGLIFDRNGNIMSRPFHKFFNINEREETQVHKIDMGQDHVIMEKMDGSMIRPLLIDGCVRLATKMGVTEVAMNAEVWLAAQDTAKIDYLRSMVEVGVTPIFEWVSRKNQIVIDYASDDLVYLGSRNNETGEYYFDEDAPFSKVPRYGSVEGNLAEYIARQREAEGREGDIIRFANGHMLKVKNDWYVRIHKTLDKIRFDRHIVELIINEEIDDAVALLPSNEQVRVHTFESNFWKNFNAKLDSLSQLGKNVEATYKGDRKRIAQEWVANCEDKRLPSFVFSMLDGKAPRVLLMQYVEKHLGTNVKWEECAKWLGM